MAGFAELRQNESRDINGTFAVVGVFEQLASLLAQSLAVAIDGPDERVRIRDGERRCLWIHVYLSNETNFLCHSARALRKFQSSCALSSDLLDLKIAWETSGLSDSGQNLAKLEVASSSRFPLHISDQNPGKTGVRYF